MSLYYISINDQKLFFPYRSFEEAKTVLQTSKKLSQGKIEDNDGNVLFSIDRTQKLNEKVVSLEDYKRRIGK